MADQQNSDELLRRRYSWEFFLSHGGTDTEIARRLKAELDPPSSVFLDVDNIGSSDEWRSALQNALRSSLVYVFLIPPDRATFTYAEEEMTIADAIYRANQETRRIVPVYLFRPSVPPADEVPFGMARLSGLALPDPGDLSAAREKLRAALQGVRPIEAKRIATEDAARQTAERVSTGGIAGLFSALPAAMEFLKPLFYTFLALSALAAVALVACAVASIWVPAAERVLAILGVLLASLLALTLTLTAFAVRTILDINRRGIKGA